MTSQGIGVHSLDSFTLEVPDLRVAEMFYKAFGLDVNNIADGLALSTFESDHTWGIIKQGPSKRLSHVTFGAFAEDMAVYRSRLEGYGITLEESGEDLIGFYDPMGMRVEIRVASKSMPDSKSSHAPVPFVVGDRATLGRGHVAPVQPRRLAHALFFTPDIAKSVEFYCAVLGLRISDFPGPVAFLHGIHGSDHHLIAFAQSSSGVGYHHSSWDVGSFDDLGRGLLQMERAGYGERGWGVGRHTLGSNYFQYIRDPWNSFVEYSFDIDYVPKGSDWESIEIDPADMLALWGPLPPADFVKNHERE